MKNTKTVQVRRKIWLKRAGRKNGDPLLYQTGKYMDSVLN
jgi:hypothetical protein